MNLLKLIVTMTLFSLSIPALADQTKINHVVATVNGKDIFLSDLEVYHRSRLLSFSDRKITKIKSLGDLINRELTLQKARKNRLDTNPAVRAQMENALYQAQIAKDLNNSFFKIKITDKEIEKYYQTHPEYRTSLILIRIPAQPSKEQVKIAYEQALKVYQKVRENPQNFDAIAKTTSQLSPDINPHAPDIGFQPVKKLAPEYFEAINGKAIGSVVEPFRTQFGYNIVKITGLKPYNKINKDLYHAILFDVKKQSILNQYFSMLTEKAKVKVNKKVID